MSDSFVKTAQNWQQVTTAPLDPVARSDQCYHPPAENWVLYWPIKQHWYQVMRMFGMKSWSMMSWVLEYSKPRVGDARPPPAGVKGVEGAGESGSFPENEVQTLFSNIYKSEISPHDKCFSTYLICEICDKYEVWPGYFRNISDAGEGRV